MRRCPRIAHSFVTDCHLHIKKITLKMKDLFSWSIYPTYWQMYVCFIVLQKVKVRKIIFSRRELSYFLVFTLALILKNLGRMSLKIIPREHAYHISDISYYHGQKKMFYLYQDNYYLVAHHIKPTFIVISSKRIYLSLLFHINF